MVGASLGATVRRYSLLGAQHRFCSWHLGTRILSEWPRPWGRCLFTWSSQFGAWLLAKPMLRRAWSAPRVRRHPPHRGLMPRGMSSGHRKPGKAHEGRGSSGLPRKQAQASGGMGHAQGSRSPRPAHQSR